MNIKFGKFCCSPEDGGAGGAGGGGAGPGPGPGPGAGPGPGPGPGAGENNDSAGKGTALMGGDGGGVLPAKPEWAATMSDKNWAEIAANDYPNVNALAEAHNAHQAKIGADKVVIPGENATQDERDAFFTSLGRPAEAKAYEIPVPEGFEPSDADLAFQESFKGTAFELGLNQQQVDGLSNWNNKLLADGEVQAAADASKETAATQASLRQRYGAEADSKLDAANAFIANMGGDDVVEAFVKSGANRNFAVIDMFIKVAEMAAGEGGLVGANTGGGGVASIQTQINTLKADPAYTNDRAPGHKEIKARVGNLYKLRNQNKT